MAYGSISVDQINNTTGYSLGAGNASIMKNRIINGAMVINQRGFSGAPAADGNYTLDRWQARWNVSGKYTVAQSSTAPTGFSNSMLLTSSSAYSSLLSGDYYFMAQPIEGFNTADLGWGTANAKTVTLSFWVQSSLTGSFGGNVGTYNGTRSYPFSYTIASANTWQQVSITIAGDTSGTWATNNTGSMEVCFSMGMGSANSGTANAWAAGFVGAPTGSVNLLGTNGATLYITGVQLEVGSSATGFEYRQYQQELALCQRYYQIYTAAGGGLGIFGRANSPTSGNTFPIPFGMYPVPMRAAATIIGLTAASGSNATALGTSGGNTAFPALCFNSVSSGDCYYYGIAFAASAEL